MWYLDSVILKNVRFCMVLSDFKRVFSYAFLNRNFYWLGYLYGVAQYMLLFEHSVCNKIRTKRVFILRIKMYKTPIAHINTSFRKNWMLGQQRTVFLCKFKRIGKRMKISIQKSKRKIRTKPEKMYEDKYVRTQ